MTKKSISLVFAPKGEVLLQNLHAVLKCCFLCSLIKTNVLALTMRNIFQHVFLIKENSNFFI